MDEKFITSVRPQEEDEMVMTQDAQVLEQIPDKLSETPRDPAFHDAPEIDNTNRHFKGQQRNETVLCFSRKHWIVLLPYIIGFLAVLVGIVSFTLFVPTSSVVSFFDPLVYRGVISVVIIALTYGMHRFFIRIFNYYLQILVVTNFRVIQLDHTLYLSQDRDSVDLPEIQDVVIHQNGLIKTLLNYGELIITLSSVHASKTLQHVPHPEYYFRKINKTKREYITNRRMDKDKALAAMQE